MPFHASAVKWPMVQPSSGVFQPAGSEGSDQQSSYSLYLRRRGVPRRAAAPEIRAGKAPRVDGAGLVVDPRVLVAVLVTAPENPRQILARGRVRPGDAGRETFRVRPRERVRVRVAVAVCHFPDLEHVVGPGLRLGLERVVPDEGVSAVLASVVVVILCPTLLSRARALGICCRGLYDHGEHGHAAAHGVRRSHRPSSACSGVIGLKHWPYEVEGAADIHTMLL